MVSLSNHPDARPIKKGNLRRPTEFGYKVAVADEDLGFVTDDAVSSGNPADSSLLAPTVTRHTARVGKASQEARGGRREAPRLRLAPTGVATDAGMASGANEKALMDLGVVHCSLPKLGKKTEADRVTERSAWFRRLQRFRAGGEGRISVLKRKYGWRHSRLRGLDGVKTWIGWGAIAHNLSKYAQIELAKAS